MNLRRIILTIILFICFIPVINIANSSNNELNINTDSTNFLITIIYDNYAFNDAYDTDWGYSCLIKTGSQDILFDAGTKAKILLGNIKKLEISTKTIDQIVISHNHFDHIGGLSAIQELNKTAEIFMPYSTPEKSISEIKKFENKVVQHKNKTEIFKNVYLSGEMGVMIKEQCIVLDTEKGLVVLTGCSHPGIVKMLKKIKSDFNKSIYAVMGGFHLMGKSENDVKSIIASMREMKIHMLGATHCTGDKQIDMFKKAFGDKFIDLGVGRLIEF